MCISCSYDHIVKAFSALGLSVVFIQQSLNRWKVYLVYNVLFSKYLQNSWYIQIRACSGRSVDIAPFTIYRASFY